MQRSTKILILVIFALLLGGGAFVMFQSINSWESVTADAPEPESANRPVELRLIGRQFYWTVWYPGADQTFGQHDKTRIDSSNILGLDPADPHAYDDLVVTEAFHIPVQRDIHFTMWSLGVLHGAYFPHFRMSMAVTPGMETECIIRAEKTTAEMRANTSRPSHTSFNYMMACNEICGIGHYDMHMTILVDDAAAYERWRSTQPSIGQQLNWQAHP